MRGLLILLVAAAVAVASVATSAPLAAAEPPKPEDAALRDSIWWLATGDSYSSGEGTTRAEGDCQLSEDAWASVAREQLANRVQIDGYTFAACAGAVASDFYQRRDPGSRLWVFPRQEKGTLWEWAQEKPMPPGGRFDVVTMTFGGNDIKFADVVKDCIGADLKDLPPPGGGLLPAALWWYALRGCDIDTATLEARLDAVLPAELGTLHTQVKDHVVRTGGRVAVLGYPSLVASPAEWDLVSGVLRCNGLSGGDALMLRAMAERLNGHVKAAAKDAGAAFIDVARGFDPPGESHLLCGRGEDWINTFWRGGILRGRKERAFHPNDKGHEHEAELVATDLEAAVARWDADVAARAGRTQVAYLAGGQLWEVDGTDKAPTAILPAKFASVGWTGADRDLVGTADGSVFRWSARTGQLVTAACDRCQGAAVLGTGLAAIANGGGLQLFNADTLAPLTTVATDLQTQGAWARFDPAAEVVGVSGDELIVLKNRVSTSAYGGPMAMWGIKADGTTRLIEDAQRNLATMEASLSPDGTSIAFVSGGRGGGCAHHEAAFELDLATGASEDHYLFGDDKPPARGSEERFSDLFWNGDVLYGVQSLIVSDPIAGSGCIDSYPWSLWREDGSGWQLVDSGPLYDVRPLAPGAKVVVLTDRTLWREINGTGEQLATDAQLLASTPPLVEVDLTSSQSLPAPVVATLASIRAAATAGDNAALGALAGPGFQVTFGRPPADLTTWFAQAGSAAAVLEVLDTPVTCDARACNWHLITPSGLRTAIGLDGSWKYLLSGD